MSEESYNFKTIDGFYEIQSTIGLLGNWKIQQGLRRLIESTDLKDEKKKCQWEIEALGFLLEDGLIKPYFEGIDGNKEPVELPDKNKLEKEFVNYIKRRAKETHSEFLKARYYQILWNLAISKNQSHAKSAIDSYLNILREAEWNKENSHELFEVFENAFCLGNIIAYRKTDIVNEIHSIGVPEYYTLNGFYFIALQKGSNKSLLKNALNYFDQVFSKEISGIDPYYPFHQIENALFIANKLNDNRKKGYQRLLAKNFELLAKSRLDDDTKLAPLRFYKDALIIYNELKDEKASERVLMLLSNIKKEVKLASITHEFSPNDSARILEYVEHLGRSILSHDKEDVVGVLATHPTIFPVKETLLEAIEGRLPNFMDTISKTVFDINNNFKNSEGGNTLQEKLLADYHFHAQFSKYVLKYIIENGLIQEKLNYQTVIQFLLNHSWIGQTFESNEKSGDKVEFNWISVIEPGIRELFNQLELSLFHRSNYPTFILAIDSLTLKFEALLRHFTMMVGIPVDVPNRQRDGLRVEYIDNILRNEKMRAYFSEDDLLLFEYVYTEKGVNLRNNVAHGFFKYHHYSPGLAYLALFTILRLGIYKVKEK